MRLKKFALSLVLAPAMFVIGLLACILICSVAIFFPLIVLINPDYLNLNES